MRLFSIFFISFLFILRTPAAGEELQWKPVFIGSGTNVCNSSETWVHVIKAKQEGHHPQAAGMMQFAFMTGECWRVPFPGIYFKGQAVAAEWPEDDGTGTPGAVVAGWILKIDGTKGVRGSMWVHYRAIRGYFTTSDPLL